MAKLILPKTFIDRSPDGKYSKFNGMPKLSYSQYSAWNSIEYKSAYIKQYIAGIDIGGNLFSTYGSSCGTYIEGKGTGNMDCHKEYEHLLSDSDREFLHTLDYPENSIYEDYIVINMGNYCIEGFMDRGIYTTPNTVIVEDFKTGSIAKKKEYYASKDYRQTNLYAYQKDIEGYEIEDCRVLLLDRAGNNSAKSPIRLTGKIEVISTPYDKKDTETFLEDVTRTAHEISDYYKQYLKLFK